MQRVQCAAAVVGQGRLYGYLQLSADMPLSLRVGSDMTISTPNTTAEIEIMKGKNGKPIKIENLPSPGFPARIEAVAPAP